MNEYISREFMLKNLEADKTNNAEHCEPVTVQIMDRFIRYVKEFPAADVQPVDRWISVDDKLPKEWYEVLVYREIGKTEQAIYVNGKWKLAAFIGDIADVTHWQPLPEPPKDGDK